MQNNYALIFNGRNSYVEIEDNNYLSPENITIEFYLNLKNINRSNIVEKYGQFQICQDNGIIIFNIYDENLNIIYSVSSIQQLKIGEWYYIALTFDGINIRMYINNKMETEKMVEKKKLLSTNNSIFIGKENGTYSWFNGLFDELRIWNFSKSNIDLLKFNKTVLNGSENGLIGYWMCDDGNGDNIKDNTSNKNFGKLYNIAWSNLTPEIYYPIDSIIDMKNPYLEVYKNSQLKILDTFDYEIKSAEYPKKVIEELNYNIIPLGDYLVYEIDICKNKWENINKIEVL